MIHDRNMVWTTRDGDEIKLKDLTTSHLKNIIKMLERNHGECVPYFDDWRFIDHSGWLETLNMELLYREKLSHLNLEELIRYFLGQKGWLDEL